MSLHHAVCIHHVTCAHLVVLSYNVCAQHKVMRDKRNEIREILNEQVAPMLDRWCEYALKHNDISQVHSVPSTPIFAFAPCLRLLLLWLCICVQVLRCALIAHATHLV